MTLLTEYDLRLGTSSTVPRGLTHPLGGAVERAVVGSHNNRGTVRVAGSRLHVYADYSFANLGLASFAISASLTEEPDGLVETPLYIGAVAVALATAPRAWRHILQEYVQAIATAPPLVYFAAPGTMPKQMSWLCGFLTPEGRGREKLIREQVRAAAKLAGLFLDELCQRSWATTVQSGGEILPDPESYPELQEDL